MKRNPRSTRPSTRGMRVRPELARCLVKGLVRVGKLLCLSALLVAVVTGCRLVQKAANVPGQTVRAVTPGSKTKPPPDPVEVQQTLFRLADEFSGRMILGVEKLRRDTNIIDAAQVLQWKIAIRSETTSIASGPNVVADLLDLTMLASVTRSAMEDYWQPKVFGDSAQFLLENVRETETNLWQSVTNFITLEQRDELMRGLAAWRTNNPPPESLLTTRAVGLAAQIGAASRGGQAKVGSGFGLLDPFSGLDPAVRELTLTRLFAERALYVVQKTPMVLRWQTELLSLNTASLPEVRQLVTNSTQIASSLDRFSVVAEKLPGQVSAERQEILSALEEKQKSLTPLVNEVRDTLTAGAQMSTSLNTTLTTFDALMKRFGVGETKNDEPPKTNSQPFRIQDYGQTAAQLEAMAKQLTELLVTLDQTLGSTNLAKLSAQVSPAVAQAQSGGKQLVDYAFWKVLLLVAVVLAAALVYRFISARLHLAIHSKTNPP